MKKNNKRNKIFILITIMVAIIGFSYAFFEGIRIENDVVNNKYNITFRHENDEIRVFFDNDNGSLIINNFDLPKNDAGSDIYNNLKFTIQNSNSGNHDIFITWKNLVNSFCQYRDATYNCTNNVNDIYVGDEIKYALYSCSAENYALVTDSNVNSICTRISDSQNDTLPISGSTSVIHADNTINIPGNSINYYVLSIIVENLTSKQNYQIGKSLSSTFEVHYKTNWHGEDCELNPTRLHCAIVAKYPPIADNIKSMYVINEDGIDFLAISSAINGQGMYQNLKNNGDGSINYFRGGDVCSIPGSTTSTACTNAGGTWLTLDNYVTFGGRIWRIIRISEDGSIRLIDNDLFSVRSAFGTASQDRVGWTYNRVNGDIGISNVGKIAIENWYESTLNSYDNYIQKSEYCNDTSGLVTAFGGSTRMTLGTPTFSCPITDKNYGGKYYLKVGLITADEMMYAGSSTSVTNATLYINNTATNVYMATMTPANTASYFYLWSYRYYSTQRMYNNSTQAATSTNLRAVINLKPDVVISGGNGSVDTPWVVLTT